MRNEGGICMIKRKIICTLLVLTVMIPCLFVAAFAIETTRQSTEISLYTTYTTCSYCYTNKSSNIKSHSGKFSCSLDGALAGSYSCENTNYAKTELTAAAVSVGYKEAYVYERDSSGVTKTDLKTSNGAAYPGIASVNPVNTYVPVCVRHEVCAPDPLSENTRLHIRNYE